MYWLYILFLLGAALAASPDNHKRDLASIQSSLDAINVGLQKVDTAVLGIAQGTGPQLLQLGQQAVPLLQNASAQIRQSAQLSLEDSLNLAATTQALRMNTNLTINDLIAQKPLLDQSGSSPLVAAGLSQQRDASNDLAVALASKVAPDTPNVVQSLDELAGIFDRAIAAFSGTDPAAASQLPPAPTLTAAPSSGGLAPVTVPAPTAAAGAMSPPVTGQGTVNADGSCNCAVQCPAGSFGGVMGGAMVMRYM
ncbi:hypothetical protein diail_1829 [Diaporthe ilicicola]|nr:hypothetical protein diail_1829 [Diaporthe ilicicola]